MLERTGVLPSTSSHFPNREKSWVQANQLYLGFCSSFVSKAVAIDPESRVAFHPLSPLDTHIRKAPGRKKREGNVISAWNWKAPSTLYMIKLFFSFAIKKKTWIFNHILEWQELRRLTFSLCVDGIEMSSQLGQQLLCSDRLFHHSLLRLFINQQLQNNNT